MIMKTTLARIGRWLWASVAITPLAAAITLVTTSLAAAGEQESKMMLNSHFPVSHSSQHMPESLPSSWRLPSSC